MKKEILTALTKQISDYVLKCTRGYLTDFQRKQIGKMIENSIKKEHEN